MLLCGCRQRGDNLKATWRSAHLNHLWIAAVKAARSDAASGRHVSAYSALSRIKSEVSGDRDIHPDRQRGGSWIRGRSVDFPFPFLSHLSDSDAFPLSMTLFSRWRSSGGVECIT